MKQEEQIAKQYFEKQGYVDIKYEPDGQRPPDLLLNNDIAVEVRRLNQQLISETSPQPIESLQFSFIPKLMSFLKSYGTDKHENSSFVWVNYSRPLSIDFAISQIKKRLDSHPKSIDSMVTYNIDNNLTLVIGPSESRLERQFVYGGSVDEDYGGMVLSNIFESLKVILKEKEDKVRPYHSQYKTWWLALIDHIGFGLGETEKEELKLALLQKHSFHKIIFISPLNPEDGFELD